MLFNTVPGFYGLHVEACVADVVRDKGLFSHPWSANLAFLKALMVVEVHATQLQREMYAGQRYTQVSGWYPHSAFFF